MSPRELSALLCSNCLTISGASSSGRIASAAVFRITFRVLSAFTSYLSHYCIVLIGMHGSVGVFREHFKLTSSSAAHTAGRLRIRLWYYCVALSTEALPFSGNISGFKCDAVTRTAIGAAFVAGLFAIL